MKELIRFLEKLDSKNIYYKLNKVRDSVMVEIAVPGQRWEIEFMDEGDIQIEKFISNGEIYGREELATLFNQFSD